MLRPIARILREKDLHIDEELIGLKINKYHPVGSKGKYVRYCGKLYVKR